MKDTKDRTTRDFLESERRGPGRPRTSELSRTDQIKEGQRSHRERKRKKGITQGSYPRTADDIKQLEALAEITGMGIQKTVTYCINFAHQHRDLLKDELAQKETEYLLSSDTNARRLQESIDRLKERTAPDADTQKKNEAGDD